MSCWEMVADLKHLKNKLKVNVKVQMLLLFLIPDSYSQIAHLSPLFKNIYFVGLVSNGADWWNKSSL